MDGDWKQWEQDAERKAAERDAETWGQHQTRLAK